MQKNPKLSAAFLLADFVSTYNDEHFYTIEDHRLHCLTRSTGGKDIVTVQITKTRSIPGSAAAAIMKKADELSGVSEIRPTGEINVTFKSRPSDS